MKIHRAKLAALLTLAGCILYSNPSSALDIKEGEYRHRFNDGSCGIYTVNSSGKVTKYQYGRCGKAPKSETNNVRLNSTTLKAGGVTISDVSVGKMFFRGLWLWKQYKTRNKRFCRSYTQHPFI